MLLINGFARSPRYNVDQFIDGNQLLSAQIQPTRTWALLSLGIVALMVALTVSAAREAARLPNPTDGVRHTSLYK